MTIVLTVQDRLDIEQTIARYAHILNNRDFGALHLVFTADAILRTVGGNEPRRGIDDIRDALSARPIPDHSTTNVCIDGDDSDVRVWSMYLVVMDDGRTVNGDYLDRLVQTADGWRIAERTVVRRTQGDERNAAAYADWLFSRR